MPVDLSRYAVAGATRPDSFSGMKPEFQNALAQMFAAAPPEIAGGLQIGSGYRSPQRQAELWEGALKKYGNAAAARKWVAPPGRSQHNHGSAADLYYQGRSLRHAPKNVVDWAHQNAGSYGLAFPLSNENWHVELAGARGGGAASAPTAAGAPATASRMLSPQPMAQTPEATMAPALFGDLVAANQVQTVPVPQPTDFATYLAQRKAAEAEAQAADQQRKLALFGDDLFGVFG